MLVVSEALSPVLHLVRASGNVLDTGAPGSFLALCEQACTNGATAILIDLGAPQHCSSAGLAGLIDLYGRLSRRVNLALCNPGAATTTALKVHGIDRALNLFASVEVALQDPQFRKLQLVGMRAVVLCAGNGSRMRPMTRFIPKPMLDVTGRPVLAHILAHLDLFGLQDIVLNPGHLGPQIPEYFQTANCGRQSLFYLAEGQHDAGVWQAAPLGSMTTLARLNARHFAFHDDTFVLCGDALIDIDLPRMLSLHRRSGAAVTIAAQEVAGNAVESYGILVTDSDGGIVGFQEKPRRQEALSRLANTGIYLFRPEVLNSLAEVGGQDIARDLFPRLLKAGMRLQSFQEPFCWADIGCGRDYYRVVAQVLAGSLPQVEPTGFRLAGKFLSGPVWVSPGAHVSPAAEISGPCHVGAGARVEAGARIVGPCAIGAGALVEGGALVHDSLIWSQTRVPSGAWVNQMIAGADWAVAHAYADGRADPAPGLDGLSAVTHSSLPILSTSAMAAS